MMDPNSMCSRALTAIAASSAALDLRAITLTINPKASDDRVYRETAPTIATTLKELVRRGHIIRTGQRRYYRYSINPTPPNKAARRSRRKPSTRPARTVQRKAVGEVAQAASKGFTDIDRAKRKAQAIADLRRAEDLSLRGLKPRSGKATQPETVEEFFARGGMALKLPMHATANPLGGDYSQNPKHNKRCGTVNPKRSASP